MRTDLLALPFLLLAPFASASSSHKGGLSKRSHRRLEKASQEETDIPGHNSTLTKRQSFPGRGTFYYTGLGACGQYSKDSDYIVALNSAQYGGGYPGPQCFKSIVIQANGVTVGGVTIMDECPTCDWGGLDLSPALFRRFADEGAGVINVNWWFADSAPAPAPTTSTSHWVAPTSTWTPPPPTSTWTPPTSTWSPPPAPTTTWTPPPSSTSTWVAPSSSSTMAPPPSSSSTSSYVAPSSSSSASSSSFSSSASASVSANATVNPFAIVASYNATESSTSNSVSISAASTGVAGATESGAAGSGSGSSGGSSGSSGPGNLETLNGLVLNYGQLIVMGAQRD